jgi:hypothetical protein
MKRKRKYNGYKYETKEEAEKAIYNMDAKVVLKAKAVTVFRNQNKVTVIAKVHQNEQLLDDETIIISGCTRSKKRPRVVPAEPVTSNAVPFTDEELEVESKKEPEKRPLTKQEIKQDAKKKQSRQANSSHKDNKKRRVEWLEKNTVGGSGEKKCKRGCGKPISLCDCPDRKA